MEDRFFDVMVDIETGGTDPDFAPVIQIAAVKFDLNSGKVDSTSMFNRCLLIPPRRFWDESTRQWWSQQKREILQDIYARMEDPRTVLQAFADWCGYNQEQPLRFWGKPTHFDYSFIQSYLKQFDIPNPFHYRYACDMNSFIRGLARDPSGEPFKGPEFEGDAHNALFDVLHQIKTLFAAKEAYSS